MELLYIVSKKENQYIVKGLLEREAAHKTGMRHISVIILPFVKDGEKRGAWIIHNRYIKQALKGQNSFNPSYNLFGGHCNPDTEMKLSYYIDRPVSDEIIQATLFDELKDELLLKADINDENVKMLEKWDAQVNPDGEANVQYIGKFPAAPYPVKAADLIRLGIIEYEGKENVEYSYVYALPVPKEQVCNLIAADDYIKDGQKVNVALPVETFSEKELRLLYEQKKDTVEICDAITRLWDEKNAVIYEDIKKQILEICEGEG